MDFSTILKIEVWTSVFSVIFGKNWLLRCFSAFLLRPCAVVCCSFFCCFVLFLAVLRFVHNLLTKSYGCEPDDLG